MRKLLIIAALILAFVSSPTLADETLNQFGKVDLRGPVKSVLTKIVLSDEKPDQVEWTGRRDFDEHGKETYSCSFNPDGSVRDPIRWQYMFKENRVVRAEQIGEFPSETLYEYDDAGHLVVMKMTASSSSPYESVSFSTIMHFNATGKLVDAEMRRPDGSLDSTVRFAYSQDARTARSEEHDRSGKTTRIAEIAFNPEGKPVRKVDTKYADDGPEMFQTVSYQHDERGLLLKTEESIQDCHGGLVLRRQFEYGGFDLYGNWTTMMIYEWDSQPTCPAGFELKQTEIRSIIYWN